MKFEREQPGLRLHRSIIFWSGLLVMGFIVWAWRVSTQRSRYLTRGHWSLASYGSGVSLGHCEQPRTLDFGQVEGEAFVAARFPATREFRFGRPYFVRATDERAQKWYSELGAGQVLAGPEATGNLEPTMAMFFYCVSQPASAEEWELYVPYWIFLASFAGVWMGLLVWRWRRRRKCQVTVEP